MFVKICGITNEDDALLAVAMGADARRLRLRPVAAPGRAVSRSYDITRRLPPEILTVGVFRDEHPSGSSSSSTSRASRPPSCTATRRRPRSHRGRASGPVGHQGVRRRIDRRSPTPTSYGTDLILLDAADARLRAGVRLGAGRRGCPTGVRLILAGGLTPDNVADADRRPSSRGASTCRRGVERVAGPARTRSRCKRFIERARAGRARGPYLGADELPYDWADE